MPNLNHEQVYKIIEFKPDFGENGEAAVRVQINNSTENFHCLIKEIYSQEWIKYLSREDCIYLANLYLSEKENKSSNLTKSISINILILAALYTGLFILSNIAGSKIININSLITSATLIFFPITFILDDIITEVYGFKISRIIIWGALVANLLVIIGSIIVVKLNPADSWHDQRAFESVFLSSPRIFIASTIAYLVGEFMNSVLLAKIKIYTKGKYLWLRSITSAAVGTILDSFIFCIIAFYGTLPFEIIIKMISTEYLFKISYVIIAMPLIYKISSFLKKKDNIDVYDFDTNFNPFSIH